MTRLSGIQILVLGIVLWGLAVWLLDAPSPSSAQTPAATGTAASEASTGTTAGRQTDASGSVQGETTAASVPSTPANQPPPASSDSAPTAESASLRAGSASGVDAASATASSAQPAVASTATPAPAATTGDGTHLALAPATPGTTSSGDSLTGTGPAAGSPMRPSVPETGRVGGRADDFGRSPWTRPNPWPQRPELRPPPPFGARGGVAGGNAVAGEINAARQAAWEGRLADAVAHYRAAARIQPDHHVVWGEMGNVLWAMRRWSEAAYALEGAATLLVRAGEFRAASELVPAVGQIDPDAAYRIQRLLFSTAQRQAG